MAGDRVDAFLDMVRKRGGRLTTCRRALIAELVATPSHVTADDLAERVQAAHPAIHRSTIYRSLGDLEELGIVDHVHLGHGRAVYHLADDAHQHLVCDTCGEVTEVPDELFRGLEEQLLRDHGFRLQPGHFAVSGTCAACSGTSTGTGVAGATRT